MTENSGGLLLDGQGAGTAEYSILHQGSSTQAELENPLHFQAISRAPGPPQPQAHAQAESFPLPSSQASLEETGLLLPRRHSSPGIAVREAGANGFRDTSEASYSQGDGYEEQLTGLGTSLYDDDTYTAADAGQPGPRSSHDFASISQQLADEAAAAGTSRLLERGQQRVELTRVPVICNGNRGVFVVERQVIVCLCRSCVSRAAMDGLPEMELSPTDFERHSGSALATCLPAYVHSLQIGLTLLESALPLLGFGISGMDILSISGSISAMTSFETVIFMVESAEIC